MEPIKVLVIEDEHLWYKKVTTILDDYPVSYFPENKADFDKFSKALRRYAVTGLQEYFLEIKNQLLLMKPDCVILDLCLRSNDRQDKTGKQLREKIITPFLPETMVCFLTSSSESEAKPGTDDHYIYKDTSNGLDYELEQYFGEVFEIKKGTVAATNEGGDPQSPPSEQSSLAKPKASEQLSISFSKYIWPWLMLVVDLLITLAFYLVIIGLFLLGASIPIIDILHRVRAIDVTEHVFVAFLPFLVSFGFFVFYRQSLRQFILQARVIDVDYNEASKLMNLTKKLFVSSLISYLFIRLIELVLGEGGEASAVRTGTNAAEAKPATGISAYFEDHPDHQAYFIGAGILLLILYFIYLNLHKDPSASAVDH